MKTVTLQKSEPNKNNAAGKSISSPIAIMQPRKLMFGAGCFGQFIADLAEHKSKKVLFIIAGFLRDSMEKTFNTLTKSGVKHAVYEYNFYEPTVSNYNEVLETARGFDADTVVGIGGGSVLDMAKIIAAMQRNAQTLDEVFGINNLKYRSVELICLPTTSGTGSEVSPNSILLDEKTYEKKGIISPYLMPDASYIDPALTISLPPKITAETGMDALSHCIEAYTNKFSHPLIDGYALKGIELIARNLLQAYKNGNDIEARSAVALGSMYGGICLGPVNTAAVHALSYPLGGKYHIPHGLANAVLLPEVMAFNMEANVHKHAKIAIACGVENKGSELEIALKGVEKIRELSIACKIPQTLTELNIKKESVNELAELAMKVQRLLKNNPREVSFDDAVNIYHKLF